MRACAERKKEGDEGGRVGRRSVKEEEEEEEERCREKRGPWIRARSRARREATTKVFGGAARATVRASEEAGGAEGEEEGARLCACARESEREIKGPKDGPWWRDSEQEEEEEEVRSSGDGRRAQG